MPSLIASMRCIGSCNKLNVLIPVVPRVEFIFAVSSVIILQPAPTESRIITCPAVVWKPIFKNPVEFNVCNTVGRLPKSLFHLFKGKKLRLLCVFSKGFADILLLDGAIKHGSIQLFMSQ